MIQSKRRNVKTSKSQNVKKSKQFVSTFRRFNVLTFISAMVVASSAPAAWAIPEKLIRATPHDAVAAFYLEAARPWIAIHGFFDTPDQQQRTPAEMLMTAISRARAMGLFGEVSDVSRIVLDLLQCWPVIHRYPRVYVLHDIRLRRLETGGNRLDGLAMSLVLQAGPDSVELHQLIQHFLNSYTNDQTGRLEDVIIGGLPFHRLTDSSVPSWVVWEWGQVDDLFIVSVGAGSCERVVRSLRNEEQTMLADEWFRVGHRQTQGQAADFELYLDVASLQNRLGEGAQDRFYAVIDSLGIKASGKRIWTIGSVGEAVTCYAYHRREGVDDLERISDPQLYRGAHRKLIPSQASGYAIFNTDAAALLRRVRSCFLAAQRSEKRLKLMKGWEKLTRARKIDFERDVLGQLGDHIIIHNYPEHPLRLSLMWTVLIEIKGDSRKVQRAVHEMLHYCSLRLDIAAARKDAPVISPVLRRSSDGIWYLQYGIYGPAVAVTDGWLIISYSPEALRANLRPPAARKPASLPALLGAPPQSSGSGPLELPFEVCQ